MSQDVNLDIVTVLYTGPGLSRAHALPDSTHLAEFVSGQRYQVTRRDAHVLLLNPDFQYVPEMSPETAPQLVVPQVAPEAVVVAPAADSQKVAKQAKATADATPDVPLEK